MNGRMQTRSPQGWKAYVVLLFNTALQKSQLEL